MTDILVDPIVEGKIKHSRKKIEAIRFKEDVVNKIKSSNYAFGKKRELLIPFKMDKDTHRKGLKLKIYRGNVGEPNNTKKFIVQFWLNDETERINKNKLKKIIKRKKIIKEFSKENEIKHIKSFLGILIKV